MLDNRLSAAAERSGAIRQDMIVATEVLQLHSDRVLARAAQIASQAKCPEDVFTSLGT